MTLKSESLRDALIAQLVAVGALRFGSFRTKSGRDSPYFVNFGALDSAEKLGPVADVYAATITEHFGDRVGLLFGPAYKGIPLAVLVADRLSRCVGRDVGFAFNRKEAKSHGEGGSIVGSLAEDRGGIVIVEDVLTAGTSLRESHEILASVRDLVIGIVVGVDREEPGQTHALARDEIEALWGVPLVGIATSSALLQKARDRRGAGT